MADFDPDAYLSQVQPQQAAFDPDAYLASAKAPSLPTQVVQPRMGLADMLFDPETAQNLRGAVQDVVYSLPGMAAQIPKMAYEGLKFATGGPQERTQVGTEALSEAVAQGQQMSKDVMSPLGSRESFRGIANLGLMAAPAVGEVLGETLAGARGKFVNITPVPGTSKSKPPIQGEALPQIPETPISDTVQPSTESPIVQQVNEGLSKTSPTTNTAQDVKDFFASAKGAVSDSYTDAIWKKVQDGKPIERIAPLENTLREAQKAGTLKTRDDVAAIIQGYGKPTAETPTTVGETTATRQAGVTPVSENNLPVPLAESSKDLGASATTTAKAAIESYSTDEARDSLDRQKLPLAPIPEGMINAVRTPTGKIVGHGIEHGDVISRLSEKYDPNELTSGWVLKRPTKAETDATFIGTDDVQKVNGDFDAAFRNKGASPVSEGGAGTQALISKGGETPPTVSETTTGADTGSKPVSAEFAKNEAALVDKYSQAYRTLDASQLRRGNPLDLRPAYRKPNGEIVSGNKGEVHADLPGISRIQGQATGSGASIGYVTPEGKFLNKEEAYQAVKSSQKDTGAQPVAAPVSESGSGLRAPVSKEGTAEAPTTAAPPEPAEVPPVSTKNEYTDAQRAARGVPEAEQAAKRDFGTVWDEAAKEAEKDPSIGQRLVSELNNKPREVSDTENAHLLRTEIAAQTEHSAAVEAVNKAKTPEDLTAAKSRLELARHDLQDVYDATKRAGTKSGQALASRQMLAKEDYTLAAMEARRRAANDGAPLNEKQLSEVNELHEKITDLQSKLDAHEVAQKFNTEFSRLVNETRKEARASKATTKFNDFMDRKANEARARIVERRGRLTTGFDPSMIADEAIIGASHIAKGVTKFADWSGKMVDEFGDAVRPFLKDIWDKARTFHAETGKEYGEKALARYKTYLGKQTEQIQGKLEAGDFTKAERQRTKLDAEAFTMRANLQKLKNEFERGVAKEAYQKKTPAQKFWDHFVGVERAMKLSGPEVFGKLGVAAFTREALAPVESAGGYATSKLFPRLAAGTKYGANLPTVVRAELKAKAAMFTKGMADAAQNVLGKETELDAISGSKIRPDFWYNRIGQMHAAIKAPVKRAEFTRSLEQRMDAAVKAGEDIHHPEVMTRLANESVMDANRAIFQQKTVVSSFFSMLDKQVPVAGRTARFLFPVIKIPVNLFKELVTYHAGAPVAATKIGMAYWKGVETLPPIQREAIIRQFTKGSIGGAALLWGYFNSDKVRKFFDNAPQWFGHTPMAMVLNEGSYLKKLQGTDPEKKEGTKELAYMAKTDIPFMYSVKSVTDALDSHNSNALMGWINNMVQSSTVPQLSTQVAKTIDKPGSFPSNLPQRPNYRVANNPIEAVKLGIPGKYGRESVPLKAAKAKNTTGKGTYGY